MMMFFHAWCCGTSWNLNSVGCAPLCLQNCGHAKQHKYTKLYIISTYQFSEKILQNMLRVLTVLIIHTGGNFTENWLSVQLGNSLKIFLVQFFENWPMPTPIKLRNPTIVGSHVQWLDDHLWKFFVVKYNSDIQFLAHHLVEFGVGPFSKNLAVKRTQSIKHKCISST